MLLFTWGSGGSGQLCHGDDRDIFLPKQVQTPPFHKPASIRYISGGGAHILITMDYEVYGCGWNENGQVGVGVRKVVLLPQAIPPLSRQSVRMTAAGWNHSLALTEQGVIYVWGNSDYGQLGLDMPNNNANAYNVHSMSVSPINSPRKSSIVTNRSVDKILPVPLDSLKSIRFTYVAAGLRHSAAVTEYGKVFMWGEGKFGQLGLSKREDVVGRPVCISDLPDNHFFGQQRVIQVACGSRHSIFLTEIGEVWTTGWGKYGQLGHGTTTDELKPRKVGSIQRAQRIQAGWNFSLVLADCLFSFGRNNYGQLGIGNQIDQCTPQVISSLKHIRIVQIACGSEHSLVLTENGEVFSWGWSEHGQLGHGNTQSLTIPTQIKFFAGHKVLRIYAGGGFSVAILQSPT
jgi:alpha-tubulin suppressor-like RCC1 family protein